MEHSTAFEDISFEFCAPCESVIELKMRHRPEYWGTHNWAQDEWHPICSPNIGYNHDHPGGEQFLGRTCYNHILSSRRRALRRMYNAGQWASSYATCDQGKWTTGRYTIRGMFANLENQFRISVDGRQFMTDQRDGSYGHVNCSPDGTFLSLDPASGRSTGDGKSQAVGVPFVPPTPAPASFGGGWGQGGQG